MKPRWTFASALAAACLCAALGSTLCAGPAWAQQDPAGTEAEAKKEKKTSEERITEYLQKKEQKRVQREQQRLQKEESAQVEAERAAAAKAEAQAAEQQAAAEKQAAKEQRRLEKEQTALAGAPTATAQLPKQLARAQESVRLTALAQDPTIQGYLDLVDRQEASPHQLAALGNFLADVGLLDEAMAYYSVALGMEKEDPLLWINVGTLHRQRAEINDAIDAYARALSLDRNNAVAHYNLGAALDVKGKYDEAVEEYKTALTLDPSLGDPSVNPGAVNNPSLMVVRLLLYQEQVGRSGLPLLAVPGGELQPPSAEADTPQ